MRMIGFILMMIVQPAMGGDEETNAFLTLIRHARANANAPLREGYKGGEIGTGLQNGRLVVVQGTISCVDWRAPLDGGIVPFGHTHPGFDLTRSYSLKSIDHGFGASVNNPGSGVPSPLTLSLADLNFASKHGPHVMYTTGSLQETPEGPMIGPLSNGKPAGFLVQPVGSDLEIIPMDGMRPLAHLRQRYQRLAPNSPYWISKTVADKFPAKACAPVPEPKPTRCVFRPSMAHELLSQSPRTYAAMGSAHAASQLMRPLIQEGVMQLHSTFDPEGAERVRALMEKAEQARAEALRPKPGDSIWDSLLKGFSSAGYGMMGR